MTYQKSLVTDQALELTGLLTYCIMAILLSLYRKSPFAKPALEIAADLPNNSQWNVLNTNK